MRIEVVAGVAALNAQVLETLATLDALAFRQPAPEFCDNDSFVIPFVACRLALSGHTLHLVRNVLERFLISPFASIRNPKCFLLVRPLAGGQTIPVPALLV